MRRFKGRKLPCWHDVCLVFRETALTASRSRITKYFGVNNSSVSRAPSTESESDHVERFGRTIALIAVRSNPWPWTGSRRSRVPEFYVTNSRSTWSFRKLRRTRIGSGNELKSRSEPGCSPAAKRRQRKSSRRGDLHARTTALDRRPGPPPDTGRSKKGGVMALVTTGWSK